MVLLLSLLALTAACGGGGGAAAPAGPQDNGSIERPYTLTVGTGRDEQVAASGTVYYDFTTDAAGGTYLVTLSTRSSNVGWELYSAASFSTGLVSSCSDLLTVGDLTCTTSNLDGGTTYYLAALEGSGIASKYRITVRKGSSEGSINSPVALTVGTPRSSGTDTLGNSYYLFTTGAATGTYVVSLNTPTITSTFTVDVYSDATFSTLIQSCNDYCMLPAVPPTTTYYVRTGLFDGSDKTYDIIVAGDSLSTGMTYTSTDVPQSIPDGDIMTGVTSTVTAAGGPASITKVTVTVDITHPWDDDIELYLISPQGTWIMLSTINGGVDDNYTDTVFDDFAATAVTAGTAPFTGTYRPETALAGLIGENANGLWTLRVFDSGFTDIGTLNSWSITIR